MSRSLSLTTRKQQLNLFDEPIKHTVTVHVTETNEMGESLVHDLNVRGKVLKDIIKNNRYMPMTKEEVISLYRRGSVANRRIYGYESIVKEDNRYYSIFFRFFNITTSKNDDVFDFIEKHWDKYFNGLDK